MFIEVLPKELPRHLETLSQGGLLQPFYLAGGTGAALQLGYRISVDLDFFSFKAFDPHILVQNIAQKGDFTGIEISPATLHGIFEETRMSFFHYPYPLIEVSTHAFGVEIASLPDIACMKIDAIASRGSRKDFIDLYVICQRIKPLSQLLRLFEQKYQGIKYNKVHILKAFCYFEEAEQEPLPRLLSPLAWEDVKDFFVTESQRITSQWF